MTLQAESLRIVGAGTGDDPLLQFKSLPQAQYLQWYLADLGAATVLVEQNYFDRDFLSEFSAFYCTSSAGYRNACERWHYFSIPVTRECVERAAASDEPTRERLQEAYLGFIVRRPIPGTPLGRTVLRWYPDLAQHTLPRVDAPSREYTCNIAGFSLTVRGVAWQQQDAGVGACATIALWSMLQSSANDDRHVVPTTAEVTTLANAAGISEQPTFPSDGLSFLQSIAAVRDFGFAPMVVTGHLDDSCFEREHFCSALASFLRSGYPVMLAGNTDGVGHAVCAVGFRQAAAQVAPGMLEFEDTLTEFVYLHDDNLGPAARFQVETLDPVTMQVALRAAPPPKKHTTSLVDPTAGLPPFVPFAMLAAAPCDVRVSPAQLSALALQVGASLMAGTDKSQGLTISSRIIRLSQYLAEGLAGVLKGQSAILGRTRLALLERVPPMSLHLAVIRFGLGRVPVLDILYDTTDSPPNMRAFCFVAFRSEFGDLVDRVAAKEGLDLGIKVDAH